MAVKTPLPPRRRTQVIAGTVAVVYVLLFGRIVFLQTVRAQEFRNKAADAHKSEAVLKPVRGRILDCNGVVLARTVEESRLTLYPKNISDSELAARLISQHTGLPYSRVLAEIKSGKSPNVLLPRMPRDVAASLKSDLLYDKTGPVWRARPDGAVFGVEVTDTVRREYPLGPLAAKIVGVFNSDGKPVAGVELRCNAELSGKPGKIRALFDRNGDPIPTLIKSRVPAVNGADIVLTIDSRIQLAAEKALKSQAEAHRAESAECIVIDPETGAIRALAEYPFYDPSTRGGTAYDRLVPISLTQAYEPGSTAKLITAMTALKAGLENVTCPCTGTIFVGKLRVNCPCSARSHLGGRGVTIADMLKYSCNTESSTLARKMGAAALYRGFRDFRVLEANTMPGWGRTRAGLLPAPEDRGPMWLVNASFGQGVAMTRVNLALAYAAVANQGDRMKPMLVSEVRSPDGTIIARYSPQKAGNVGSEADCATVLRYLVGAVEDGTGKNARLDGFQVAGKTGSAQMFDKDGVIPGAYISSFVGIAPADDPAFTMLVTVERPKGSTHGSVVAAPVFKEVAKTALWCAGKVSSRRAQPAPAAKVSERGVAGEQT